MLKGLHIQQIWKTSIVTLLVALWMLPAVYSQMTISIDDLAACEESKVDVSVDVSEFLDVSAFTLYIEIDTLLLIYESVLNPHTQLAGGSIIANIVAWDIPTLIVTWTSFEPANIADGKLFDLKFEYLEGTTPLNFIDGNEIVLSDLSIVEDAAFKDGSVFPLIEISQQPETTTALEGQTAEFLVMQNGGTDYQWQVNHTGSWEDLDNASPYSGADTDKLTISNVPLGFDGYLYRCLISAGDCEKLSGEVILEVMPLTIDNTLAKQECSLINIYPNPCGDVLNFRSNHAIDGFQLQVVDLIGNSLFSRNYSTMAAGTQESFSLMELKPGMYYVRIFRGESNLGTMMLLRQ